MRKLPNCPICEGDELWLQTAGKVAQVKCYECGWGAVFELPLSASALDDQIAEVVAKAQPQRVKEQSQPDDEYRRLLERGNEIMSIPRNELVTMPRDQFDALKAEASYINARLSSIEDARRAGESGGDCH